MVQLVLSVLHICTYRPQYLYFLHKRTLTQINTHRQLPINTYTHAPLHNHHINTGRTRITKTTTAINKLGGAFSFYISMWHGLRQKFIWRQIGSEVVPGKCSQHKQHRFFSTARPHPVFQPVGHEQLALVDLHGCIPFNFSLSSLPSPHANKKHGDTSILC